MAQPELFVHLLFATNDGRRQNSVKFVVERGELRYTNVADRDNTIRKNMLLGPAVLAEIARLVEESEVLECSDRNWSRPDKEGEQELEVRLGKRHVQLKTRHLASAGKIDDKSLKSFFYATQDLKSFFLNLIAVHFKRKPL
jgi:hypothetical protein